MDSVASHGLATDHAWANAAVTSPRCNTNAADVAPPCGCTDPDPLGCAGDGRAVWAARVAIREVNALPRYRTGSTTSAASFGLAYVVRHPRTALEVWERLGPERQRMAARVNVLPSRPGQPRRGPVQPRSCLMDPQPGTTGPLEGSAGSGTSRAPVGMARCPQPELVMLWSAANVVGSWPAVGG